MIDKKLILSLFLILLSYSSFGMNYGPSCDGFISDAKQFLKLTKTFNYKNELHFSAKINPQTCQFTGQAPINVYWVMGGKTRSGVTPCENMLRKEIRGIIGFSDQGEMEQKISKKIDEQTVEIEIPELDNLGSKMGARTSFSRILTLKSHKEGDKCKLISTGVINSRDTIFDQLHLIIKWGKLKKVKMFNQGSEVNLE